MGTTNTAAKTESTTETPAPADQPAAAPVDPFANVPVIRLHEADVQDLSGFETAAPRKYAKVAEAARDSKMPVQAGWKHERAVFTLGQSRQERKPNSVYGTIMAIAQAAGRAGINAYDMATIVRMKQVGNKRSHYCGDGKGGGAIPPVGWAEGWINSAVTRGILSVSATKRAPALRPEQTAAKGTESTAEQDKAAEKTAKD